MLCGKYWWIYQISDLPLQDSRLEQIFCLLKVSLGHLICLGKWYMSRSYESLLDQNFKKWCIVYHIPSSYPGLVTCQIMHTLQVCFPEYEWQIHLYWFGHWSFRLTFYRSISELIWTNTFLYWEKVSLKVANICYCFTISLFAYPLVKVIQ